MSGEEAKKVYQFLTFKDDQIKYKFCSGASLDGVENVDIDELTN
jgi:hypothetical protein